MRVFRLPNMEMLQNLYGMYAALKSDGGFEEQAEKLKRTITEIIEDIGEEK